MNTKSVHSVCVVGAADDLNQHISTLLQSQSHQLDSNWQSTNQASAELLLIDPDSVYGHMDWLRAQSSGRPIVACTHTPDAFAAIPHLRKPIAAHDFVAVLNRIGAALDSRPRVQSATPRLPRVATPTPTTTPSAPTQVQTAPAADAAAVTHPPATPSNPQLLDLLGEDSPLSSKTCLAAPDLAPVFIDPATRQWHADSSLKALAGWCSRSLAPTDMRAVTDSEFAAAVAALPGQPYARLAWLAHLTRGGGQLAPHLDAAGRFQLVRWPQSEREFPKHFRIASAMLKEAATVSDIAAQTGASPADVADFINAYHALGFVEHAAPQQAADEGRRGGLFSRARKISSN